MALRCSGRLVYKKRKESREYRSGKVNSNREKVRQSTSLFKDSNERLNYIVITLNQVVSSSRMKCNITLL